MTPHQAHKLAVPGGLFVGQDTKGFAFLMAASMLGSQRDWPLLRNPPLVQRAGTS